MASSHYILHVPVHPTQNVRRDHPPAIIAKRIASSNVLEAIQWVVSFVESSCDQSNDLLGFLNRSESMDFPLDGGDEWHYVAPLV